MNPLYQPKQMPSNDVIDRAKKITLLILDVDGVLTTGYLDYNATGEMVKSFYVQDGLGLQLLRQCGIQLAIISGRNSAVTAARARDLKIHHVIQGAQDKGKALSQLVKNANTTLEQCAYMGDDIIDLPILHQVGLACSVPNGHFLAQAAAHWVSHKGGGAGAVRELSELILFAQNKLAKAYNAYLDNDSSAKLEII